VVYLDELLKIDSTADEMKPLAGLWIKAIGASGGAKFL